MVGLASLLIAALLVAACGDDGDDGDDGQADADDSAADDGADLPGDLADDPITEMVGADVMAAAIEEGEVNWYGGGSSEEFKDDGGFERFHERFGITVGGVQGASLRDLTDRVRTEVATGNIVADVVDINDMYIIELHTEMDALMAWENPNPNVEGFPPDLFVRTEDIAETDTPYWTPIGFSPQALFVNTEQLPDGVEIESYWDIVDPALEGKVAIRDARAAAGGAWQALQMSQHPDFGVEYFEQLEDTVGPHILSGGPSALRDAIATGQFAVGFGGRAEFLHQVPDDAPVEYIEPEEGVAWTSRATAILEDANNPNAAKVLLTWLYEIENLQVFNSYGRPVGHPDVGMPFPEMEGITERLMTPTDPALYTNLEPFFAEMNRIWP